MAIEVIVKQSGLFKKKIDLAKFEQFLGNKFQCGMMNGAYVLVPFAEISLDGQSLIVYNPNKMGRGFFFWLSENKKECHISLNSPSTTQDIIDFYNFIKNICHVLSVDHFSQDGDNLKITNMAEIKNRIIDWNIGVLKQAIELNPEGLVILGANNPIAIETKELATMSMLEGATLVSYFEDYLDNKQQHDYYYMQPNFFQNNNGDIFGVFALTEKVPSIIPLKPYITLNSGLPLDSEIGQWIISLIAQQGEELDAAGYINYADLTNIINLTELPHYDRDHVIFELSAENINALRPYFIEL